MYNFDTRLMRFFTEVGFNDFWARMGTSATLVVGLLLVSYIAFFLFFFVVETTMVHISKRTKTLWDDALIKRKVIRHISHMVPGAIIYFGITQLFPLEQNLKFVGFVRTVAGVYMVTMVLVTLNAFLNAVHDIYLTYPISKDRQIKTYIQLVKIFFFFIGGIIIISILLNRNPLSLILGLGAMSAVLMLIFKDTILGLVASVQASVNNLVKPGDWIEMPSRNTDGTVLEITLNTVKVQNWNNTISSFPTYALISESFRNWRNLDASTGRMITRSVYIDSTSVHFCTAEEIALLQQIPQVARILDASKRTVKEEANNLEIEGNTWNYTNLGIFRRYVNDYLAKHSSVSHSDSDTYMMRMSEPSAQGIPMQVYCYSKEKEFNAYEDIQASIMEHIYAAMNAFDLRAAQRVTNQQPTLELKKS